MIPKKIEMILERMEKNGVEAYLVGGFVRDTLLKKKTNDFDIATNALPKELTTIFGPSKRIKEYGSYHLKIENFNVDITSYRKEIYQNHKLIKIEYTTNMLEDMKRRDFTINALYMNRKGDILDPYHYEEDIKKKIIRTIGNPKVRLEEDPLRILRAIRFASKYSFQIDSKLQEAIKKSKKNLSILSKQLIKKELDAILLANGFSYLKKFQLLSLLGLEAKEVIYVEDLAGLWAQINTTVAYPTEKNLKKRQKKIEALLKCDTIKMFDLYKYGYYDCMIAAKIKKISEKKIEKLWNSMAIHTRKDIVLKGEELSKLLNIPQHEFGNFYRHLEESILLNQVSNDRESIIKWTKEVEKKCQTSNF